MFKVGKSSFRTHQPDYVLNSERRVGSWLVCAAGITEDVPHTTVM